MDASRVTRKSTNIWLVGPRIQRLSGKKLPSQREVIALFFHHHLTERKTIRSSASSVVDAVLEVWEKVAIPTQHKRNIVGKVEKLFDNWKKLKKNKENKAKRSDKIKAKERNFFENLDGLFDIAHANAMKMMKSEKDKLFLLAQREKGRRGYIGPVDVTLTRKEERKVRREEDKLKRQVKEKVRQSEKLRDDALEITSISCTESEELDEVEEYSVSQFSRSRPTTPSSKARRRARKNVLSCKLAETLDRTKVSDRKATLLLTSFANTLGHDVSELNLNRSSIRRQRAKHRKDVAHTIKKSSNPSHCLTVHWDGKLLPDITGKKTVDRLSILVSGAGEEQLLGVPKLNSGTGDATASAVNNVIRDWNIQNKVCAMSFDTTASNTGNTNGACALLEHKLGKTLLHLPCRHHIHELVLEAVFSTCMGTSSGPDILLFKRFQKHWELIDTGKYSTALDDIATSHVFQVNVRQEILLFMEDMLLNQRYLRDDYRELLELAIIFLGGSPPRGIRFMAPGAMHRARWMAKGIYAFKVYLFRDQFQLTTREIRALRRICTFVTKVYIKAWYKAPLSVCAPKNDLLLLQALQEYNNVDLEVANAALKKFSRHLWYLSEELVSLAFFDNDVSVQTKQLMVEALGKNGNKTRQKKATLGVNDVNAMEINSESLVKFVSANSLRFFQILGINSESFLTKEPDQWDQDNEFIRGKEISVNLRVVNDTAERGVAIMQEFNQLHTTDQEQKQYLLLVVKEHRKKFPDAKKSTIIKALKADI